MIVTVAWPAMTCILTNVGPMICGCTLLKLRVMANLHINIHDIVIQHLVQLVGSSARIVVVVSMNCTYHIVTEMSD